MSTLPDRANSLRPCPFCGKTGVQLTVKAYEVWPNALLVTCPACGASGPASRSRPEAVHAWNHRAAPAAGDLSRIAELAEDFARAYEEVRPHLAPGAPVEEDPPSAPRAPTRALLLYLMAGLLLAAGLAAPWPALAQSGTSPLRLSALRAAAAQQDPRAVQPELLARATELRVAALRRQRLPQLALRRRAWTPSAAPSSGTC